MIIFLYTILFIVGLSVWLWLAYRISRVSDKDALLGLFLVLPAFYWTYKLWHDRRADLHKPAIANLVVNLIALPCLVMSSSYYDARQIDAATAPKADPHMAAWCRERNDSVYDPVLGVCVEPSKSDALTEEQRSNTMGQLEKYLNQYGIAGEIDRSADPEVDRLKASPDIADGADFRLLPRSEPQRLILMLICVSESACTRVAAKQKKSGANIPLAQGKMMLLIAPDSIDDAILGKMSDAMSHFSPS